MEEHSGHTRTPIGAWGIAAIIYFFVVMKKRGTHTICYQCAS
jgi:hypothetical protein